MWQILIKTKQNFLEDLSPIIEEDCVTTSWIEIEDLGAQWDSEDWFIEGHCMDEPDHASIRLKILLAAKALGIDEPHVTIQPLRETNWLEEMWEKFPPQHIGPFFVHSSQFKGAPPPNTIPIILNAATAFGSGDHGTTSGCMMALCDLLMKYTWQKPLDLGCGSGILAIAATKLNPVTTLAIDNDPEAVRVTRDNAIINNSQALITAHVGEGLKGVKETFDLVMANILAAPLIDFAPLFKTHIIQGGYAILSGLLDWQEKAVSEAYAREDFSCVQRYEKDRWVTLVMKK